MKKIFLILFLTAVLFVSCGDLKIVGGAGSSNIPAAEESNNFWAAAGTTFIGLAGLLTWYLRSKSKARKISHKN